MTCHNCTTEMVKAGFYGRNRVQRWKCQQCGKRFAEPRQKPFGEDLRLPAETVERILHCLVEGNSVRSTSRLCDVEKRTVLNILKLAGGNCERILTERIRNVVVEQLQMDEIWTFVRKKEAHKFPFEAHDDRIGDAYTFIALERNKKLVLAWHLGRRDRINTENFIAKVRQATAPGRFEICTDGFEPYVNAIADGLGDRADYSQIIKVYSKQEEGRERYSPGEFVTLEKKAIIGEPDMERAGTSHVERQNGTLRQWCKRLTRLTYAFSKSWDNLKAALALHFAYYNFCRVHSALRVTPAMEAGIADRIWAIGDLIQAS
jgi:IS1 family transposase/transposase-like protein